MASVQCFVSAAQQCTPGTFTWQARDEGDWITTTYRVVPDGGGCLVDVATDTRSQRRGRGHRSHACGSASVGASRNGCSRVDTDNCSKMGADAYSHNRRENRRHATRSLQALDDALTYTPVGELESGFVDAEDGRQLPQLTQLYSAALSNGREVAVDVSCTHDGCDDPSTVGGCKPNGSSCTAATCTKDGKPCEFQVPICTMELSADLLFEGESVEGRYSTVGTGQPTGSYEQPQGDQGPRLNRSAKPA